MEDPGPGRPRKAPVRKDTNLPAYSVYPPLASIKSALAAKILPSSLRAFSTDSDNGYDSPLSPPGGAFLSPVGRIIGTIEIPRVEEPLSVPVASTSVMPPPPVYTGSTKPVLLWLDGGGTKVVIETYFLNDIMYRLAWDLKFVGERIGSAYSIPPKDCFDWIGGCGTGAIIAFMVARGMTSTEMTGGMEYIAPELRKGDMVAIQNALAEMITTSTSEGTTLYDLPSQTNVWIPAEADIKHNRGECIMKGESLKDRLLPFVLREVKKEFDGTLEMLDATEHFLHGVCPVWSDCSFLLSLGTGKVPERERQTWWQWWAGENGPSVHPDLPPPRDLLKNDVIPREAYSMTNGTYIRLQPDIYANKGGHISRLDDWMTDFTPLRTQISSFTSRTEKNQAIDRAAFMLRWRDIPGPVVRRSEASKQANANAPWSHV